MRRRAPLLLLLALALAATVAPASASAASIKNPAQMVVDIKEETVQCSNCGPNGTPSEYPVCSYAVFVQFPDVAGAKSYNVVVRDNHPRVNTTRNFTGPPFNDDVEGWKAPAGTHRFGGLTGGGGPPPCPSDPYQGGRFEILKSTVSFGDEARIIGRATKSDGSPAAGVKVSARGPRNATATTNAAGTYSMKVRKGRYSVSAGGLCVKRAGGAGKCDKSANVTVGKGPEKVDFGAPFKPTFSARPDDTADPGRPALTAIFEGRDFDPDGGPITIRWSGRNKWTHLFTPADVFRSTEELLSGPPTLTIPAAESFSGRLVAEVWPNRSTLDDRDFSCSGKLTATQNGASVSGRLRTDQARAVVLWAERDPDFRRDDVLCAGELGGTAGFPTGPVRETPGLLVLFDVYSATFLLRSPRHEVPFAREPASKACAEGRPDPDGCVVRVICLNKRGKDDVAIYWDTADFKRRGALDFAWRTGKPCREGEGGLTAAVP